MPRACRARELASAPVRAEMIANDTPLPETSRDAVLPVTTVPKTVSTRAKRAEAE